MNDDTVNDVLAIWFRWLYDNRQFFEMLVHTLLAPFVVMKMMHEIMRLLLWWLETTPTRAQPKLRLPLNLQRYEIRYTLTDPFDPIRIIDDWRLNKQTRKSVYWIWILVRFLLKVRGTIYPVRSIDMNNENIMHSYIWREALSREHCIKQKLLPNARSVSKMEAFRLPVQRRLWHFNYFIFSLPTNSFFEFNLIVIYCA